MTTKKKTTQSKKRTAEDPAVLERKKARALAVGIAHVPFVPVLLIGRTFTAIGHNTDNWLGAASFTVLGDMGPLVVPGHQNASGTAYVHHGGVALDVGDGIFMTVSRADFWQLTRDCYRLAPVAAGVSA